MIIRPETAADHDAIRKVNDEAFGDPIEAKIVDAIRASDRFLPELSLVAVSEGQTLGHVISSYVDVEPGARRVLQVGPLAVLPSHQRRGIGSALMEETLRIADARGEPLLLIEGNPKYYERFGFTRADAVGIEPPPEAHGPQYFMIRPLTRYDSAFRGRAVYPPEHLRDRVLAGGADGGSADVLRSPGAWPGEGVERKEEPRCAHGGPAFFSASVPVHGRLTFSIGAPVPALETRPLNGGREPDTPGVH